mmetsp:Transcript_8657/g.31941  ORF Transcript_8657/g.31941 Transcript_8657/m.31941 type:complete len:214 (-) Transcript_8657:620-1261(-)
MQILVARSEITLESACLHHCRIRKCIWYNTVLLLSLLKEFLTILLASLYSQNEEYSSEVDNVKVPLLLNHVLKGILSNFLVAHPLSVVKNQILHIIHDLKREPPVMRILLVKNVQISVPSLSHHDVFLLLMGHNATLFDIVVLFLFNIRQKNSICVNIVLFFKYKIGAFDFCLCLCCLSLVSPLLFSILQLIKLLLFMRLCDTAKEMIILMSQ